eukprot:TRINITY_DN6113_c0_g2_i1.p1 TRINITY_DN6113_c0_g2~~TRINITY_DN6113_c0_g2_i1.p1  ORF type:complete len:327 (-),score=46.05 TRINITY_DN6113_c0_g2_i1:487-1467(-)
MIWGLIFLITFGSIELLYVSACLIKVPRGGWLPLGLAVICMLVMYVWHYVSFKKYEYDLENNVSIDRILHLGPSLGIARVPGIGLVFTDVASGVPAIFGHFVTNLPAFHQVLVFLCVKCVQIPKVSPEERLSVDRIGPKEFRIFRCIVRYGYKDIHEDCYSFENQLVLKLAELIHKTGKHEDSPIDDIAVDIPSEIYNKMSNSSAEIEMQSPTSKSPTSKFLNRVSSIRDTVPKGKKVRFALPPVLDDMCQEEKEDELSELFEARETGVAYILGHTYVHAKETSSIVKKLAVDALYSFLQRNCRSSGAYLGIPHTSLLQVGMICYI